MIVTLHCKDCGNAIHHDSNIVDGDVACPKCGSRIDIPVFSIGPGTVIHGFRLEKKLGQGAMGVVYLATQLAMNRRVALKILPPEITGDTHLVRRFLREVQLLARVEHPNIVTAFDAGDQSGIYYLAMTYVDGQDVEKRLEQVGRIPEKEALNIIRGVARALQYAWDEHRILHNDVKPGNIIIDTRGNVKLMDLGLSKNVFEDMSMSMSGMGKTFGTPNYMSPEQAQGVRNLDTRSDQYALGATLYRMVTGALPHDGTSVVELLTKKLFEPIPPARMHNPDVTDACEHLLEVLMATDRSRRYENWKSLIDDIERVQRGEYPHAPRPGAGESTIDESACSPDQKPPPAPKPMVVPPKTVAVPRSAFFETRRVDVEVEAAAADESASAAPSHTRNVGILAGVAAIAVACIGGWYSFSRPAVVPPPPVPVSQPTPEAAPVAVVEPAPAVDSLSWSDDFNAPGASFDSAKWLPLTAPVQSGGEAFLTGPSMEWGAEGLMGAGATLIPIDAKGAVEARIVVRDLEMMAADPDFKNAGYFDLILSPDPTRTAYVSDVPFALVRLQYMTNHVLMFQLGVKLQNARPNSDPKWIQNLTVIPRASLQEPLHVALVVSAEKLRVTFVQKDEILLQRLYWVTFPEAFVKNGVAPELYVANQGKGRIRAHLDDFHIRPVETAYLLESTR
ncbi:MAG: serine/threonine-protein kinase [bacterium]